jgi:hypothetical protein
MERSLMTRLIKIFSALTILLGLSSEPSLGAAARPAEEIWKSLEKLPAAEREKKLIEGAKSEGEMLWYTNSGVENATHTSRHSRKTIRLSMPTSGAPKHARSLKESSPKPMRVVIWST